MKNSYANNSSLKFPQMTDSVSRLYDAYLLDLDGTVLLGDSLILGAAKAIKFLKSQNKRVVFISNNSTSTAASYAQKLTSLGVPTENDDVINSSMVLINFLNENIPNGRLLVIGETALCNDLIHNGYDITNNDSNVDAVIVSFDRGFNYQKLQHAFDAIQNGARFFATNGDKYRPLKNGGQPDAGAIVAAIEACTGKLCEVNVGKPSRHTIDYLMSKCLDAEAECIVVGDRPETDIQMGINSSIDTALVLSGVTKEKNIKDIEIEPTYIIESVESLVPGDATK